MRELFPVGNQDFPFVPVNSQWGDKRCSGTMVSRQLLMPYGQLSIQPACFLLILMPYGYARKRRLDLHPVKLHCLAKRHDA
jgi:hypothetical protein